MMILVNTLKKINNFKVYHFTCFFFQVVCEIIREALYDESLFFRVPGGATERTTAPSLRGGHVSQQRRCQSRLLRCFGSDVGGVCAWKKWTLAMHEFDHSEIRSAESVNGAKTGP